jgi:hypothetical protein
MSAYTATRVETTALAPYTEFGPWSGWAQITPKGLWFLNVALFRRSRNFVAHWPWVRATYRCTGYMRDPLCIPDVSMNCGQRFWGQQQVGSSTTGESTTSGVDQQLEFRFFDPPDFLPDCRAIAGPIMFRGDFIRIETNWLAKMPSVSEARFTLNGHRPVEHNKRIELADMPVGHQFLDIDFRQGRKRRNYQISFSTQNKLDVLVEQPTAEITIGDGADGMTNTTVIPIRVRNNTDAGLSAILSVSDVPPGWMGVLHDQRPFNLKPHEEREVMLQVELMNDVGYTDNPYVPFTISGTWNVPGFLANRLRPHEISATTVYVQPSFERKLQTVLQKSKAEYSPQTPYVY